MELREGRLIANTLTALIPDGNALVKLKTKEKKSRGAFPSVEESLLLLAAKEPAKTVQNFNAFHYSGK